jgi:D-inositol-3-phosphate glycosyltransferase
MIADLHMRLRRVPQVGAAVLKSQPSTNCNVTLLTGGSDKPYVIGLTSALTSQGVRYDLIGSDELSATELINNSRVNFCNLRGDQNPDAKLASKIARVMTYYWRLICYALTAKPKLFHILWNNKFELLDRTVLMFYYKLAGKRVVLTAHNVNMRKRDGTDNWLNRLSLRIQYRLADHIFVHTQGMKNELVADFGARQDDVSVIPFGINNTVPNTKMTSAEAQQMLGISKRDKVLLCFGQIAPYKGLDYLIAAFTEVLAKDPSYRLIIAGKPKRNDIYWKRIKQLILDNDVRERVIERIEHVPDDETEIYFKAADVLVLPYTSVFQSGVIFLAYSFGLPVIATDVGGLKEQIIEGETGFVSKPRDSANLAGMIAKYFHSELFRNLENRRLEIKAYANQRYSWDKVAAITKAIYSDLLSSDV